MKSTRSDTVANMSLEALIIPELQELAHALAKPSLNYGVPAAYLAATLGGQRDVGWRVG